MKEKDLSKFLIKVKACDAACLWYAANKKGKTYKQLVFKLLDEGKFQWINWIFCQVFLKRQKIMYAIYCAEQVIDIFEKKYKDDKRPREAVEAAKRCVEKSNVKNKNIAKAANKAAAYAGTKAAAKVTLAVSAIPYGDVVAYAAYAIYCAEQVIDIFEKKYKDDKRPREAVEAAKRCVEKSNVKNKNIAKAANKAAAAVSAISYGDAVAYAAYAIHCAAHAAAYVGSNSVFGKNAPYSAGKAAAYAATEDKKTLKKIIKYGMTLV